MKLAATHAIAEIARKPTTLKRRTPSVGDIASLVGGHIHPSSSMQSIGLGSSFSGPSDANGSGSGAAAASNAFAAAGSSGASEGSSTAAAVAAAHGSAASCSTSMVANGNGSAVAAGGAGVRYPSPQGRAGSPALRPGSPALAGGHRRRKSKGQEELMAEAAAAAQQGAPSFGRNYIIPRPFDDRLAVEVAAAVVQAAIDTGVARITDIDMVEYKRGLTDLTLRMNL